ncbi:MAG: zf-HC2 domain-containing protein [Propionibacteriaceae bacterium]|jgi:anti-sigma factor (TIGR02949 family)|nr:zf-HC2 domain-containing protein [Propionibacteriaceae bacterium]
MDSAAAVTCLFVLQRLNLFLDREMDEATADLIRQHISQCEECADEAECWIMLRQVVQRAYQPSAAPPDLLERISALIATGSVGDEAEAGQSRTSALNRWEGKSNPAASSQLIEADWNEQVGDRLNP